jgi:hypothetical protein
VTLAGHLVGELQAAPLAADAVPRRAGRPYGPPGSAWALIELARRFPSGVRTSRRAYSPHEWQVFLARLGQDLVAADVLLYRLDERGYATADGVRLQARLSDADPSWVYLEAFVREGWLRAGNNQHATLEFLRDVAERCDPSFGQVCYQTSIHRSPLEEALALIPDDELVISGRRLRGYGWLTVCSQQIGDELGGLEALRATGAFAEADRLANGGYWLLATPRFEQYDLAAAERIFQVLAPKLPTGKPIGLDAPARYGPPTLLANRDAADFSPDRDR